MANNNDKVVPARPHVTVARLIEHLGSGIVDVLAAPDGLEHVIDHPTIHDPAEPLSLGEGELLLAVGVDAAGPDAIHLVQQAAGAKVAGIIVKQREGSVERLVEAAQQARVTLLSITPEMTWTQLHALIRTIMMSAGLAPESNTRDGVALGDLFGLANAVAAMIGGPVTIEDLQSRVLAYSSLDGPIDEPRRRTILGRRVPDEWVAALHDAGIFRQLWGTHDVVRIEKMGPEEIRPRLTIAVRAGDEIVGSIWVAEGDSPLGKEAEAALREAAKIASLHLVRSRYGEDVERRMRGDVLRRILDGRGPLNHLAERIGIKPDTAFAVVAFELLSSEEAEIALQRERALELVALYCEAYRRRAVQVPIGPTIYALLPLDKAQSIDGVHRLARDVLTRSRETLSVGLLVGIGSAVSHLRDVPKSRQEADQVLRVLATPRVTREVATIADVRAQALLMELHDYVSSHPELLSGKLDVLYEHDATNDGSYIETLRAYLDHFGDVPSAARSLEVHPNTFRYRVRRLGEVADLDLEDPDERLAIELQLRLGTSSN